MATYIELRNVADDTSLRNRIDVAVTGAATSILAGASPTTEAIRWAANVLSNPRTEGIKALRFVIMENAGAGVTQIVGASDSAIQANVDVVVPALIIAFNS